MESPSHVSTSTSYFSPSELTLWLMIYSDDASRTLFVLVVPGYNSGGRVAFPHHSLHLCPSDSFSVLTCLVTLLLLKSSGQFFCRMSLKRGLSGVLMIEVVHIGERRYRSDVPFSVHMRTHMTSAGMRTRDVNHQCLVRVLCSWTLL